MSLLFVHTSALSKKRLRTTAALHFAQDGSQFTAIQFEERHAIGGGDDEEEQMARFVQIAST